MRIPISDKHFNSIKVRLKLNIKFNINVYQKFQFHKGTIKTAMPHSSRRGQTNFNSIKVRLKHAYLSKCLLDNSLFQFHKGTIKTAMRIRTPAAISISIP